MCSCAKVWSSELLSSTHTRTGLLKSHPPSSQDFDLLWFLCLRIQTKICWAQ
ncbi:hypothetical protein I79_004379 [Cricetulus griseus]|uniref:Uncharacterized protein n=1 Tax=Cricetulus griseus TaxID=10029 RepID=G3H2G6_CRIGR|nr:hypothetical protein I79_004379 [Cricetulus griseus]